MRLNGRKCAADICGLVLVFFVTILASAQLSSPVSGSLSEPLDTNIYGLNSNVAPTTSSTITPGANNLLTPDEHVLPYDAIEASVIASPLNPSLSQSSYVVGRIPFQVDNSLRDASIITGLHFVQPGIVVDYIARKSAKMGASTLPQSSWLNGSTSTQSSLESLRGQSISGLVGSSISQPSSWRAGGSSAAMMINPPDQFMQTSQQSGKALKDMNGISLQNKKQSDQSGQDSGPQPETARDYSRSPVEKAPTDKGSVDTSASPFGDLENQSFLSPDITSPSFTHKAPTRGTSSSFTSRAQSGSFTRRSSRLLEQEKTLGTRDQRISNSMSRSTRLYSGAGQMEKPKWHNPVLQQMENEANSARQ